MSTRVGSFLYRCLVEKQRSGPYPCAFFSKLTFSHHLPSLLALPFPQQKPASKDHTVIPSSRLHHWLPLSQVPILKGRSSEPLLSRVFVYGGHTTPGDPKILCSSALCA